ncbi:MAG: zinc ribbon domain-containing protein [Dehalococcoidia bacterium]
MTETELLKNLQLLDTRIDTLENRLQEIESEITDDSEVVEADNIHKAVCLKFDGLSSNRRSLERTVSDLTLRQSSINDRMYDGTIQNEKEFAALQEEFQLLSQKISDSEDELLEAMDEHERYEKGVEKATLNLENKKTQRIKSLASLKIEKQRKNDTLTKTVPSRDDIRSKCNPKSLISYDRLRKSKGGLALATMESDLCSACKVAIPSQLLQKLKSGETFVHCNSCQRILCLDD